MIVLISQTEKFLGVETLNQETVNSELAAAEGRTDEAGSSFTPVRVNTPLDLPYATITVLFRPFPWETHNGQTLVTSFEGVFLIVLTIRGWRRLRSIPRSLRREPYVAYCLGITLTFVYAFSSFSNFGILARQRCQVMPFFLVLICLEQYREEGSRRDRPARETRGHADARGDDREPVRRSDEASGAADARNPNAGRAWLTAARPGSAPARRVPRGRARRRAWRSWASTS